MKRFEITYDTDGNRNIRRRIIKGHDEHEAMQRFLRMMKAMNICECQFEIFSIEEA